MSFKNDDMDEEKEMIEIFSDQDIVYESDPKIIVDIEIDWFFIMIDY